MHLLCKRFFTYARAQYPAYFDGPNRIVEFGSRNHNGSVRPFFTGWITYIGVDLRGGTMVDLISAAKDVPFAPESFDVVVSSSMFEHDPEWRLSLNAMLRCLDPTGILILTWGGSYNQLHQEEVSIDHKFHPLQGYRVVDFLADRKIHVHECCYDRDLPNFRRLSRPSRPKSNESINLIAFKDATIPTTPRRICGFDVKDRPND
jgi:SAM-dependent methyltransferase